MRLITRSGPRRGVPFVVVGGDRVLRLLRGLAELVRHALVVVVARLARGLGRLGPEGVGGDVAAGYLHDGSLLGSGLTATAALPVARRRGTAREVRAFDPLPRSCGATLRHRGRSEAQTGRTLVAVGPFGPSAGSYSTRAP